MRILLLFQWFNALRGLPLARALRDLGHDIEVLTGIDNYPSGKIFPPYRLRPILHERLDDIPVSRVILYSSHDHSAVRRTLNYLSFAASAATLGAAAVGPADVAYVYHPPGTIGLPAIVLRALRGIPFVLDVQDLWPDTLAATGMITHRGVLHMMDMWCKAVYKAASRVLVISPGFKARLIERGVPSHKIEVIYNWCNDALIQPVAPDPRLAQELGLAGRFNVMFAGNIGLAQALESVLNAAALLEGPCPRAQFVFVGDGLDAERLKQIAAERRLTNVRFLPLQPMEHMSQLFALADVLLAHLRDDPLFGITIPSKIQAYMAAERPVLCAVRGDAAEMVARAGAGVTCCPEDPRVLATTVTELIRMTPGERAVMGTRGRSFYAREFSMSVGAERVCRVLKQAAASRRR